MQPQKNKLHQFFQSTGIVSQQSATIIGDHFHLKEFEKNQLFLKEGKLSNEYLVLENGLIRAFSIDIDGNEVTTAFYAPLQPVFEAASFFTRIPSKENLQAITPSSGWAITFEDLNKLFHSLPEFREFGRSILAKGFASLKMRMLSMITETAEERYASLLKANPEIFQHAPLKYIASYLGITDTSLSRIRKEMVKRSTG
jgi:CRP-like cAMP-binding protein